jgi:hypothetical protein
MSPKSSPAGFQVGKAYFIRTVTHYYTGKLRALTDSEIVLSDAAWIADTGRFSEALKTGKLSEVEPFPDEVVISRGAFVDACEWTHPLPREVK